MMTSTSQKAKGLKHAIPKHGDQKTTSIQIARINKCLLNNQQMLNKYQLQMDEQSHVPGRSIARSVLLEGIEQGERFARETLLVRMAANHRLLKGPPNPLSHRQTSRVNKRRIKQRILALLLKILSQA